LPPPTNAIDHVLTDEDMMNIITTTINHDYHAHHHYDHLLNRARDHGAAIAVGGLDEVTSIDNVSVRIYSAREGYRRLL